eukprot:5322976-Pyramimonas_sp.AAC.1
MLARAGKVGFLRPSAPWQPPLSVKMLFGFAPVAVRMCRSGCLGVGAALRTLPRGKSMRPFRATIL